MLPVLVNRTLKNDLSSIFTIFHDYCSREILASNFYVFLTVLFVGFTHTSAAQTTLPTSVTQQLKANKIPTSAVSIAVKEIGSDALLLEHNADVPRNPASTIKLLTTFIALQELGPNYRWKTELFVDQKVNGGVLDGDLYLKGYGDPFLVIEDFWQ